MHTASLTLAFTSGWLMVAGVVAIAVLGVAGFGLRFWLASTRPADIKEISTPRLDRLNQQALERMARGGDEEEEEEAPEDLKKVVPEGESSTGDEPTRD